MDFDENIDDTGENTGEMVINQDDLLLMEDDTNSQYRSMKDCVIFLVDCGRSLIESNTLNNIFAVAESFLKTKIITNEKDIFGLICYNYHVEKKNQLNFYGIDVRIPLAPPDAQLIKNIKILQHDTNPSINKNYANFLRSEFPYSKEEIPLSNALWICHSEFKNFEPKKFNRRIFLFTDNDNPMMNNLSERNITIQRARDMLESEIVIELFPMNLKTNFEMKKFYSEIIAVDINSNEDLNLILSKENCEDRIRELTKRIRQKEVKKRTLGRCPLYLTKDVKFTVNIYATLKKTTKLTSHNVDARTNKTLNTINQSICKETGGILYQNQIGTFHAYGNTKVNFTKDEMNQIKTLDSPGIKLMGFKSYDSIKPYYNIREVYFIYPEEFLSNGASQLCDALIKQLIAKNKVAIVKFIPRDGANIRFCALIPQKESFDEDYFQTPPGFNLIFIPYADEIRSNADILKKVKNYESVREKITADKLDAVKRLIKKMNIEFDCRNFENPTIQKFYATLQALALSEGEVERVEDLLNPDTDAMKRVLNDADDEVKNLFYGYDTNRKYKEPVVQNKKTTRKRNNEENDLVSNNIGKIEKNGKSVKKGTKRNKKSDNAMIVDDDVGNKKSDNWDDLISDNASMMSVDEFQMKNGSRGYGNSAKKNLSSRDVSEEDDERNSSNKNISHNNKKTKSTKRKEDDIVMEVSDEDEVSNEVLLKNYESGDMIKFSVKKLKNICAVRNVKISSKSNKSEIINKLSDYLFSQSKFK